MTTQEIIEKIRAEVERLYDGDAPKHDQQCDWEDGYFVGIAKVLDILDTIQEQPVKTNIVEELKHYHATTPKEQIEKDLESLKEWGKVSPSVSEFLGWEQPVCEGLEEMAEELAENYAYAKPDEVFSAYKDGFIEGYKAQKKQSELSCDGLEEEINRYLEPIHAADIQFEPFTQMTKCARHFAQWQKEQDEREKHRQEWIAENDRSHLKLDSYEYIIKCALDGVTRLGSLCDDKAITDATKLCVEKLNEQMLKEAVEGIVHPYDCEIWANLVGYGYKFKEGQKVKFIIVKED